MKRSEVSRLRTEDLGLRTGLLSLPKTGLAFQTGAAERRPGWVEPCMGAGYWESGPATAKKH